MQDSYVVIISRPKLKESVWYGGHRFLGTIHKIHSIDNLNEYYMVEHKGKLVSIRFKDAQVIHNIFTRRLVVNQSINEYDWYHNSIGCTYDIVAIDHVNSVYVVNTKGVYRGIAIKDAELLPLPPV